MTGSDMYFLQGYFSSVGVGGFSGVDGLGSGLVEGGF